MSGFPLAITRVGMVTGVGLNAPDSCAAIRCAIDNFQETHFMDSSGEWIMGCEVPLERPWRGRTKLIKMASTAISECLSGNQQSIAQSVPLLLCLSERERPGRVFDNENHFFVDLEQELRMKFHHKSCVIAHGHISIAVALEHARELIQHQKISNVLIAATDSLLVGQTLAYFEKKERLLTSQNSNGFIPGEGAAALLVESAISKQENQLVCTGLGFGFEQAHIDSEEPLMATGLTTAIHRSLNDAGYDESLLEFRITDISGEQYYFKEACLAFGRINRSLMRKEFDLWHPADCIGEVGAAIGVVMIAVLKAACEKSYTKGHHILAHVGNDDGKRSSINFVWRINGD